MFSVDSTAEEAALLSPRLALNNSVLQRERWIAVGNQQDGVCLDP